MHMHQQLVTSFCLHRHYLSVYICVVCGVQYFQIANTAVVLWTSLSSQKVGVARDARENPTRVSEGSGTLYIDCLTGDIGLKRS